MKLNPWQLLIALVVLFAAIILAHLFVPTSAAAVVSMAVAAFAALFVNRKDDDPPGPPTLKVLAGGAAALALACAMVVGCGEGLKSIDEINNPSDDVKLSKCRGDARAEMLITGNKDKAWNIYLACTADAGLR